MGTSGCPGATAGAGEETDLYDQRVVEVRVDRVVVGIAHDAHGVFAALDPLDVLLHDLSEQHDTAIGGGEPLYHAVGSGPLRLPHHVVLGIHPVHPMPRGGMHSAHGVLVRIGRHHLGQ